MTGDTQGDQRQPHGPWAGVPSAPSLAVWQGSCPPPSCLYRGWAECPVVLWLRGLWCLPEVPSDFELR